MKLGLANKPQVGFARLSALPAFEVRGQMQVDLAIASQWTGRHGALRAGSAGEQPATAYGTCLSVHQNHPTSGTNQNFYREAHLNPRFPGGSPLVHASFSTNSPVPAYRQRKRGKSTLKTKFPFCLVPHLPGPEKTRSSPRADFSREGFLGLPPLGLVLGSGCGHLIPTHQVTRGNQSRNPDYRSLVERHV